MADNTTRLPCSTLGAWLPSSSSSSGRGGTRLENDDKYDFKKVCETKFMSQTTCPNQGGV